MSQSGMRVLVVDDERFFRESIAEALTAAGIETEKVASGEEALKAAEDPRVGVIVLDMGLVGMSGIEALRRLRAARPAQRVIVLSSALDQETVLEALRLDACDYLAKPLHDEELVLVVRRAMSNYGLETRGDTLRTRLQLLRAELAELAGSLRGGETSTREQLADGIAQVIARVLGATKSSLMLFDAREEVLRVVGATGSHIPVEEMEPVRIGDPVAGLAVANGEPVFANDVGADVRFAGRVPRDRYDSSSFAIVPLDGGGDLLGVLCVTDRDGREAFDEDDIALLRVLSLVATQMLTSTEAGAAARGGAPGEEAHPPHDFEATEPVLEDLDSPIDNSELARAICEAITSEIEPSRLIEAALAPIARDLRATPVSLSLLDPVTGDLALEGQVLGITEGDRKQISRNRGLTAAVLQTGRLVATDHPETDPRFDPQMDTPEGGAVGPLLCIPLRLRGKVMGIARAFPVDGADASARSGEVLSAALSAAVRNVLLYRSLLESIDEVARARQNRGTAEAS